MGNRRTGGQLTTPQENSDVWRRLRTEPRPATEEVWTDGRTRVQLIECPSFGDSWAWEMRQDHDQWSLFRSHVLWPWPGVQLIGYDRLEFASDKLAGFFKSIIGLTLPLAPDLTKRNITDGTNFQLAVFGDVFSSWRIEWSCTHELCRPLVTIADQMLEAFSTAKLKNGHTQTGIGDNGPVRRIVLREYSSAASGLIYSPLWEVVTAELESEVVAAVPNKNVMLYCSSKSAEGVAALRAACTEARQMDPATAKSNQLMVYRGHQWVEYMT